MLSEVEKFKQHQPVKVYHSGEQNLPDVLALSINNSRECADNSEENTALLKEVLTVLNTVPAGRHALQTLHKEGYSFAFDAMCGGIASCVPEEKIILLNPNHPQDLSHALVHEARHAEQFSYFPPQETRELYAADILKSQRAFEADACAYQCAFVYEINQAQPDVLKNSSHILPMQKNYDDCLQQTQDKSQAMKTVFEGWYDYADFRTAYDMHHSNMIYYTAMDGCSSQNTSYFSKELPSKKIEKMCSVDGKTYAPVSFLDSEKSFSIGAFDKMSIQEYLNIYAASTGSKSDKSLNWMYTQGYDGNGVVCYEKPEEKRQISGSVVQAAGQSKTR